MKRLTISVPDAIAAKAQRAVAAHEADNVSAYFTAVAEREPDWAMARQAANDLILRAGGVSDEDRNWARQTLGLPVPDADDTGESDFDSLPVAA